MTAFYNTNSFLVASTDVSSEVLVGKIVHIPQSGGSSGAKRNRVQVPATAVLRTDTEVVYVLDHYTSNPMAVTAMEQAELSYQKMQSMIKENGEQMLDLAGGGILEAWAKNVPNNTQFRLSTSGVAGNPYFGLTGNRKKVAAADLRLAASVMSQQKVSLDGRYFIATPEMIRDLKDDSDIKNVFYQVADYKTGSLPQYAGFTIIERADTIRLKANGEVRAADDVEALNTDTFGGLFLQKECVEHALGEKMLFHNPSDPLYFGETMSMLIRAGGRARRIDNKGVLMLTMAAA